jgi:hypothetical protein
MSSPLKPHRIGNAGENVYPRKDRPENKIDAAAAWTMAFGRHMTFEKPLDLDEFLANPIWV